MKLFVEVHYQVKPRKREEFYRKIQEQGIDTDSRAEAGNIKYDYYYAIDDPDSICLIEAWTDGEAQIAHGSTAHYAKLTALKNEYVVKAEVLKYNIAD